MKKIENILRVLLILIGSMTAIAQVSPAERQALIDLYNATDGDNWTNTVAGTQPWLINDASSPASDWFGVIAVDGIVTEVNLLGNNLVGNIPTQLGQLTNLVQLTLNSNELTGVIPAELGGLPKLRYLYLSNNLLSGEIPLLATESSSFSRLYIRDNKFNFSGLEQTFGPHSAKLGSRYIIVSQLPLDQPETLTVEFNKPITLTSNEFTSPNNSYQWYRNRNPIEGATSKDLVISSASATDAGEYLLSATNSIITNVRLNRHPIQLSVIPSTTCDVSEVEKQALIDFYNATGGTNWTNNTNWLTDAPVCDWFGVVVVNDTVSEVNLLGNNLVGNIPTQLGQLTNLVQLTLNSNELTGVIPAELGGLPKLRYLYLSNNLLSGEMPLLATESSSFSRLYIRDNKFNFSGLEQTFGPHSAKLGSRYIIVSQLPLDQPETLTVEFNKSITLTSNEFTSPNNSYQWYRNRNPIEGATSKDLIISSASATDAGEYLLTVTNSIITNVTLNRHPIQLSVIPSTTCDVSEVEKQALIDFYNATGGPNWTNNTNWLTDAPVCDWFGVEVLTNDKVSELKLPNNNLVGEIPISIGNLIALQELYLFQNNLKGDIPNFDGSQMPSLREVYLYDNILTGSIPLGLTKATNLRDLRLHNNKLTTIPSAIGDMSNLVRLFLYNNELSGSIPAELGLLENLEVIYLDDNNLEGTVPAELANMTSLFTLGLGNNKLEGKIPLQISQSNIGSLSIQGNQFVFSDFEDEQYIYSAYNTYKYAPQSKVDQTETVSVAANGSVTLSSTALTSTNNSYQWYKDGVAIAGATSKDFVISNASDADAGVYYFTATNSVITDLTLERNLITLTVTEDTCGVSESEKQALIDFYNSTDGPNWINSWDLNTPVCDWIGVVVTGGKVTIINIGSNNLVGNLPVSIGNLVNLTSFTIASNSGLTGNIPDEIGNLVNLEKLLLYRNGLTGTIPASIGELKELTFLGLFQNNLTGQIPKEIGNLQKLHTLYAERNLLSGSLPPELGLLNSLLNLNLFTNQFTGTIPPELGQLESIRGINLSDNKLTGAIPLELGNLSTLKGLTLNKNELTGTIPSELGNLAELVFLNLNDNNLTGAIPSELGQLSKLRDLYLSDNQFSGDLPFNIDFSISLSVLYIEGNKFDFSNIESKFNSIKTKLGTSFRYSPQSKVDQTETLSVAANGSATLTSTALTSPNNSYQWYKDGVAIAGATSKGFVIENASDTDAGVYHFTATNSIVNGLTLTRNPITLTISEDTCGVSESEKQALIDLYNSTDGPNWTNSWDLDTSICDWYGVVVVDRKVVALNLSSNNLNGSIPISIGNLVHLTSLTISRNIGLIGGIPATIGSLTKLESIDMIYNKLSEPLPSELGNLINLKSLNLFQNTISGVIPSSIGNLINLSTLVLTRNELTGAIPISIANLTKLTYLDISRNKLSDPIPPDLGNMINLISLNLYKNQITGSIPVELTNLTNLTVLTLGENLLTGSIPPELCSMIKLTTLSFFKNQLTGEIPSELGNLVNLVGLNFGINRLTGSIPQSIGNLTNLRLLELQTNLLTGSIPPSIGNLSRLEKVYLYQNKLEGTLPNVLGSLSNLKYLDVSNNMLSGTIPNGLGSLSNLRSLILNANNFSGPIPQGLSGLAISNDFERLVFTFNSFVFSDFENEFNTYKNELTKFNYFVQAKVDETETVSVAANGTITLSSTALTSSNNSYQWYKDGVAITGATSKGFVIENASDTDAGVYHFTATNSIVNDLTLTRNPITLTVTPAVDTCGVSEVEKQALIDLYNSTDGPNWTNSWDLDTSICDWYGVVVVDRKVVALNLSSNNLNGSIPISIGNLSSLIDLNLYNNQLSGSIPSELATMLSLEKMNLYNNTLSGSIPSSLGDLSNLKALALSSNRLTGEIPESLGNLTNLSRLQLSSNILSGSIPVSIGNLLNLKTLELSSNSLSGSIPKEIGQLSLLDYLDLLTNQLSGEIPKELGSLKELKFLQLGTNQLTGSIPDELGELSKLTYLNFANNNLEGKIPASFEKLTNLGSLYLLNNNLTGVLPNYIGELVNLTTLVINGNNFYGILPSTLKFAPKLSRVVINNNQFIFSSFESEFNDYQTKLGTNFKYSPQAKVDEVETQSVTTGQSITLSSTALTSPNNSYQWYKDGVAIAGATSKDLVISNASDTNAGVYKFTAINSVITDLTLERNPITLTITAPLECTSIVICADNAVFEAQYEGFLKTIINTIVDGDPNANTIFRDLATNLDLVNKFKNSFDIPETVDLGVFEIRYGQLFQEADIELIIRETNEFRHRITILIDLGTIDNTINTGGSVSEVLCLDISEFQLGNDLNNPAALDIVFRDDTNTLITRKIGIKHWYQTGIEDDGAFNIDCGFFEGKVSGVCASALEKQALIDFYNSTDGPNWTINTNWLTDTPVCDWYGVVIENEKITAINLASNNLKGVVSPNLTTISTIQGLDISNNGFIFSDLENVFETYESLYGEDFKYWPQEAISDVITADIVVGESYTMELTELTGNFNSYQWFKDDEIIIGATSSTYTIESFGALDVGTYIGQISNGLLDKLVLFTNPITLTLDDPTTRPTFYGDCETCNSFKPSSGNYVISGWVKEEQPEQVENYTNTAIVVNFTNNKNMSSSLKFKPSGNIIDGWQRITGEFEVPDGLVNLGIDLVNGYETVIDYESYFKDPPVSSVPIVKTGYKIKFFSNPSLCRSSSANSGVVVNISSNYHLRVGKVYMFKGFRDTITYGEVIERNELGEETIDSGLSFTQELIGISNLTCESISQLYASNGQTDVIAYFDDIRIHPYNGNMKSFVYDPKTQRLMAELDENNYATYYEYDEEGGLIRVKKETEKGIYTIQETRSSSVKRQ